MLCTRVQGNLAVNSIDTLLDLFFEGNYGSPLGTMPLTQFGFGSSYYPLGLSFESETTANGVEVSYTRIAPYVTLQLGFAALAVEDPGGNAGQPLSFNALFFGSQIGLGIDFPVSGKISVGAEFLYGITFIGGQQSVGSNSVGDNSNLPINVSAKYLLGDVTLHF